MMGRNFDDYSGLQQKLSVHNNLLHSVPEHKPQLFGQFCAIQSFHLPLVQCHVQAGQPDALS